LNTLSFAAPHFPFSIVNSSLEKLVNLAFLLAYAPDLPTFVQDVLPILNLASAIMLGLLVPVSIVAVEAAHQVADAARLALLVDVTTLQGIVQAGQHAGGDQHAAGRLPHAPPHAPPPAPDAPAPPLHAGPHRHGHPSRQGIVNAEQGQKQARGDQHAPAVHAPPLHAPPHAPDAPAPPLHAGPHRHGHPSRQGMVNAEQGQKQAGGDQHAAGRSPHAPPHAPDASTPPHLHAADAPASPRLHAAVVHAGPLHLHAPDASTPPHLHAAAPHRNGHAAGDTATVRALLEREMGPADAPPGPTDGAASAAPWTCPYCEHALTHGQYVATGRYGHCRYCKPT